MKIDNINERGTTNYTRDDAQGRLVTVTRSDQEAQYCCIIDLVQLWDNLEI